MKIVVPGGCMESYVVWGPHGAAMRKPGGAPHEQTERQLHTTPTAHTHKRPA
jgi:hypothetical protein